MSRKTLLDAPMFDVSSINDSCFSNFGEAATYTPSGGSAQAVTVIVSVPDKIIGLGSMGAIVPNVVVDLRASEVAAPAKGDAITVRSTSYLVATVEQDGSGTLNKLGLDEA